MNNRITQIYKQRYLSEFQNIFIIFWVIDLVDGVDYGFQSDMFFYAIIFTTVVSFLLLIIYATQKVRNDKLFYGKVTPWVEVTEPTGYIKTKKNVGTLESNLLFVALCRNACHPFLPILSRQPLRGTFTWNRNNDIHDMADRRICSFIQWR